MRRRRSRRIRAWEWLPHALGVSVGVAAVGALAAWLLLPKPLPPPPRVELEPRPGVVMTAGADSAVVVDVLPLPDGARLAAVIWLRGARTGRDAWIVVGCDEHRGVLTPVDNPRQRRPWAAADAGIFDLIARASCRNGMGTGRQLLPVEIAATPRHHA